jgi:hypothetical protein
MTATVQLALALPWADAGHGDEGLLAAFQLSVACDLAQATGESPRRFVVGRPYWEPDGVAVSVSIIIHKGSGAQRVPPGLLALDLQQKAKESSWLFQGTVTQHLRKITVLDAPHASPQRATSARDSQLAAVEQSLLAAEAQARATERQVVRSSAVEPLKRPSLQPAVKGEIEALRSEVIGLRARELEHEVALNRKAARVNQLQDEVSACVLGGEGECSKRQVFSPTPEWGRRV